MNTSSTRVSAAILVLCVWSLGWSGAWAETIHPVRTVDGGRVRGTAHEGVVSYLGLPYAAPPLGPLRWRAPQPIVAWAGIKPAIEFGPACMQRPDPKLPRMSEDCLTLNVLTPPAAVKKRPVMVWIHGGGFSGGASSLPAFDGSAFARSGVVFVSINYRVGRFGFFAHPLLTAENADGGRIGNYGLMDQIAALEWVKRNIAVFGGDPAKVTLFGESAGAASIDALMVAPQARGLFQAAIAESGYLWRYPDLRHAASETEPSTQTVGAEFVGKIGFSPENVDALRDIPAETINRVPTADARSGPMLDGVVLPYNLFDAFDRGLEAPVPFLLGSNEAEYPDPKAPYIFRFWPDLHGEAQARVLAAYGGDQTLMDESLLEDTTFTAQARHLARMHRRANHDAFLYRFSVLPLAARTKLRGAPHASEIVYVFDTLSAGAWPVDAKDRAAAHVMHADWVDFARRVGAAGGPFPRYDADRLVRQYTRDGPVAIADPLRARLDAIEASWGYP
jgi:para-nitrobenzyl esterase